MKISKNDPILIVGTGLTGLFTAFALQRQEFTNIHLFDKKDGPDPMSIPLTLGGNGLSALAALELAEPIKAMGSEWEQISLQWESGKELLLQEMTELKTETGFAPMSMPYSSLYNWVLNQVEGVQFHWGKELINFTHGKDMIELHFADDSSQKGVILIGADGFNSRIRRQLLGSVEKRWDGRSSFYALASRSDLPEAPPNGKVLNMVGEECEVLISPLGIDRIGVRISVITPEAGITENKIFLKEQFKEWASPLPQIVETLGEASWVRIEHKDFEPFKAWADYRVVLAGDAVHPSLPYMEQDGTQSVLSGLTLGRLLGEHHRKFERAFKDFEKERRPAATAVNKNAFSRSSSLDARSSIMMTLRNRLVPDFWNMKAFLKANEG